MDQNGKPSPPVETMDDERPRHEVLGVDDAALQDASKANLEAVQLSGLRVALSLVETMSVTPRNVRSGRRMLADMAAILRGSIAWREAAIAEAPR